MLQISHLAFSVIPLLLGTQPTELLVRDGDRNSSQAHVVSPVLRLFLACNLLPSSKKRRNTYRLETPLRIWEKHVLWRRPGYYYGNELVCEVSLQQLREDVQSDGQKSDVSVLLLARRRETSRLNIELAEDRRLD